MKKFLKKIIAFTVVFVMIFNFSGATIVQAVQLTKVDKEEAENTIPTTESTTQDETQTNAKIIGELESKRTPNEKHFMLNDGTELVAIYSDNVHYEKNGKLIDIDNSLEETTLNNKSVYQNKNNSYKVKFAKNTEENNDLVTMQSQGYEINWLMQGARKIKTPKENINKVEAKITNKKQVNAEKNITNKQIEEQTELENITSKIKYENILNQVDLEYEVKAESIKESIIINDRTGLQDEFVFRFNLGDLNAELLENKEVIIYKDIKEEYLFKIEAPYMFDSNYEYSSEIDVELERDEENNEYILIIMPSKEWLEAEERIFPITIDPTVSTIQNRNNIEDTYIYSGDEDNYVKHNAHIIRIGSSNKSGVNSNPVRGLIKFTLPELNAGDQVIYATLNLCSYQDDDTWAPPSREIQINVHRMTSNWEELTAKWAALNNAYNTRIEDYEIYQYDSSNPNKFYTFNVTGMVKDWYTTGNNYGLMLKENYEDYECGESDAYFISSYTSGTYHEGRPLITIAYRNQTGLEDYLSYHTQSVGRAGTIYTNDYNGNLVLTHYDASTPGSKLPVAINHVFNTNDKDTNIGYGKGYRLNLSQTISFQTIDGIEYGKYTDEDGTAHYFPKNGESYKDEDGLGLTLNKNNSTCTITDKSGNKSTFTKDANGKEIWYLTNILDTEGNNINITIAYNSSGNPIITKVVDGANQAINLTYSGENLETITDLNGRVTKYLYTDSKLTQIQYSDGKSSYYTYDSANKLINAKNIDGISISYEYYTERTSRVKKIQEYSTENEAGNSLQIKYGDNSTVFTDESGYSNTIIFNNYGNATSIADFGKENSVNGAFGKTYSYGESGGSKNKLTLESKMISIKEMSNNLIKNPYFDDGLNNWTKNQYCQSGDTIEVIDNSNTCRFVGESNLDKYVKQEINISGNKGDIFSISTWIKTYGIPNEDGKSVRITAAVMGTEGKEQWIDIPANMDSSSWQFVSRQFITNIDYIRLDIYLICYKNANHTYFDNIGLFKEDFGQSYTYDKDGNIISTQDKAKQNSEFTYNRTGSLLGSVNPKGGSYVYEYNFNNKNRLMKAVNATGIEYSFEYDNNGNITSAKVGESNKSDAPEDGKEYYIKIASSDKYFTVSDASTENGAKIIQVDNVSKTHQRFTIKDLGNGYYKIDPSHNSGKVLITSNNIIQQWDSNDNSNQQWKFIENTDGTYRVINKEIGEDFCIALENDNPKNDGKIVLEKWEGKQSQKIQIFKTNSDYNPIDDDKVESNEIYHIRVKSSNLYLEQENTEIGCRIIQNTYKANDPNQLWRIVRLNSGACKIVNLGSLSGAVIDVCNADSTNDNEVQMYNNTIPNPAQEWYIRGDKTGTYQMETVLDGIKRRLTVYADSREVGEKMVIYETTGGDNQEFYLEKANLLDIESGATYKIKGSASGLYLGVSNNNTLELQNEAQNNQEWVIENLNNGYYKFNLKDSENMVMDVDCASTENGTNIKIYSDTGHEAQKFEIVALTDGTYYIKPKLGNGSKAVDVERKLYGSWN